MFGLIPLIGAFAPSLVKMLLGDTAGELTKKVVDTAQDIFGSDDPNVIEKAIAKDPNLALTFRMKLLDIQDAESQRQHQLRIEEIKDIQNARGLYSQSQAIVNVMTISTVVIFFAVNVSALYGCYILLTLPKGQLQINEFTLAVAGMVGTIIGYVNSKSDVVWNFFFGSSHSSQAKSEAMSASMAKAISVGMAKK